MCRNEWFIFWRRIGGGLAAGQQQALADPLLATVRALHRQATSGRGRGGDVSFAPHETAELWRLLGSFELLATPTRIELGEMLLDLYPRKKMEPVRPALAWALGRIGARTPVYGPLNTVVPADTATAWATRWMETATSESGELLAAMQLARRTGDRYRDLPDKLRQRILDWLASQSAPEHFVQLVRDGGTLDSEEQGLVFGEALPKGLRIE
jgi:hypothetical protein